MVAFNTDATSSLNEDENGHSTSETSSLLGTSNNNNNDKDETVAPPTTMLEKVEEFLETVSEAIVDELHNADTEEQDKSFVLDMTMARSIAVLPSDIADAALQYQPPPMGGGPSCSVQPYSACQGLAIFPEVVVNSQDIEYMGHDILAKQHPSTFTPPPQATSYMEIGGSKPEDEQQQQHQQQDFSTSSWKKEEEEEDDVSVQKPHHIPISAYFLLAVAVICLSTTGPFFNLQHDVDAVMKIFWRTFCTNCFLLPLAIHGLMTEGFPKMNRSQWIMAFLAGFSYSCLGIFFVMSLDYTSVGNAMILNNSQALLLMLGKLFVGEPVTTLEGIGASVAFLGAVLCSTDAADINPKEDVGNGGRADLTLLGDALALISAFGGVGYLIFAQSVRAHLNLYLFMFFNMLQNSLYALAFIILFGKPYSLDFDRYHGLFTWMTPSIDRLPLTIVAVVFCNFFGVMGYIRAMHFFDKLVISVAGLMEPVVATILAYYLHVGLLPGWKGWLGNFFVASGTFAVVYQPPDKRGSPGDVSAH
eukprot:scaffold25685_cov127-Cylindrotheca_fusiformis.AAC.1